MGKERAPYEPSHGSKCGARSQVPDDTVRDDPTDGVQVAALAVVGDEPD